MITNLRDVKNAIVDLADYIKDVNEDSAHGEYLIRLIWIADKDKWREIDEALKQRLPGVDYRSGLYRGTYSTTKKANPSLDDPTPSFVNAGTGETIPLEDEREGAPVTSARAVEGYQEIFLSTLSTSPFKVRLSIDEAYVAELAESVKAIGILEPLLVRPLGSDYQIVAGEMRYRAALKAGLKRIPVIVRNIGDREAYELMLLENIQRKDLSDYETAKALKHLMDRYGAKQKELATKLGKTEDWISQNLAILRFEGKIEPARLQEMTHTQANELRQLSEEKQSEVIQEVTETGIIPSKREIEARAKPKTTLPCDTCKNSMENNGVCGHYWVIKDEQGAWVCAQYNKPLKDINPVTSNLESGLRPESSPSHELDTHAIHKFCPVCKSHLPVEVYDRLKAKFLQTGLFTEEASS